MKTWIVVLLIYTAPPHAVDWQGPWAGRIVQTSDTLYASQAECRNEAVQAIGRVHAAGLLAPIRFQCVPFQDQLPAGAGR